MKHLGDITKISGRTAPIVDCIIGGFPYLWEQLNGKGTCLWASEIEEFPMAVTKVRIGE
jgi:hypothetical protein